MAKAGWAERGDREREERMEGDEFYYDEDDTGEEREKEN